MHPLVRNLYKRLLTLGRDHPLGVDGVRERAKKAFRANAALASDFDIKRAVRVGRWHVAEGIAVVQLKKYRVLRERYGRQDAAQQAEEADWERRRAEAVKAVAAAAAAAGDGDGAQRDQ